MPGTPLSSSDRDEISCALIENPDVSWAEISRRIKRHPTVWVPETLSWPCDLRFRGQAGGCRAHRSADATVPLPAPTASKRESRRAIVARERLGRNATTGFPAPTGAAPLRVARETPAREATTAFSAPIAGTPGRTRSSKALRTNAPPVYQAVGERVGFRPLLDEVRAMIDRSDPCGHSK